MHELEVHQVELELQNEELRRARTELEHGLARYTELFDFAPIGYATLDAAGNIRELNHAAARLLQSERALLVGKPFIARVAPRDQARLADLLQRASEEEQQVRTELELTWTSRPVFVRVSAAVPRTAEHSTLLAFEDITERKTYEEQLERSEDALRLADRRKDEFLAALSHELRNPLMPIRNCVFLLANTDLSSEQAQQTIAIMDRQVAHMARLVDDLLDVTRIQRGIVHLQREPVELTGLVRRTLADVRGNFEASGVHLEARVELGEVWLLADPARLTQVLTNVLGNAEKFTPRGGVVTLGLQLVAGDVHVRVADNGAGIASEMLEHLFQPFTQAPQTMDRARGGLGLGLSMVKGLVELHGGRVRMTSQGIGRGSELVIILPVAPVLERVAPAPLVAHAAGRRVLVIEDNADAANTLSSALGAIGHEVTVAYDGPSSLVQARELKPDVVLCDIGLPGMDGYEVARAFRADDRLRSSFMIALSGYALPEDRRRSLEAGFDKHVSKPPSMKDLHQVIAAAPLRERSDRSATGS
ncbi:MAG: ATP-binding protein [Polyangiales bacterium]